jgi:hypothetical protein
MLLCCAAAAKSVSENWNPVYSTPSWTVVLQSRKPPLDFSQQKLLIDDKFMQCTTAPFFWVMDAQHDGSNSY